MFRCLYLDRSHGECRCLAGRLKYKEDRIYLNISKVFYIKYSFFDACKSVYVAFIFCFFHLKLITSDKREMPSTYKILMLLYQFCRSNSPYSYPLPFTYLCFILKQFHCKTFCMVRTFPLDRHIRCFVLQGQRVRNLSYFLADLHIQKIPRQQQEPYNFLVRFRMRYNAKLLSQKKC